MAKQSAAITDNMIIEDLRQHGRSMTYVIRNRLSRGRPDLTTASILRRLKRMERDGIVVRARTSYVVQICWKLAEAANG